MWLHSRIQSIKECMFEGGQNPFIVGSGLIICFLLCIPSNVCFIFFLLFYFFSFFTEPVTNPFNKIYLFSSLQMWYWKDQKNRGRHWSQSRKIKIYFILLLNFIIYWWNLKFQLNFLIKSGTNIPGWSLLLMLMEIPGTVEGPWWPPSTSSPLPTASMV